MLPAFGFVSPCKQINMSCDLTGGFTVSCKNQIGGLKALYFVDTYCDNIRKVATIDATDTMTAAAFASWSSYGTTTASTQTVFKYDLRPDLSNLVVNTNSDMATGTTSYEQVLSVTIQGLSAAKAHQLKLLAFNRAQCFVLDNNNNLMLLGIDEGLDMTAGVLQSGAARTEMTGLTFTLTGREKEAAIFCTAGDITDDEYPFDGIEATAADITVSATNVS